MFLFNLDNPKLQKLWECITFKEFFYEQAQLDEIYFYLYCRNILFRGPEVASLAATFNFVRYVECEWAKDVILRIMYKFKK